jgi:beta-galactosidase/beta-glucuronidase
MDYPRPILRRPDWVNLGGEWEFGSGERETFNRRIVVPFCPQSELSGLSDPDPGDIVWYRRRFDAPAAERLLLHFGAVDYWATVWVNGEEVAHHQGGQTPFSADITRFAGRPDNVLVVRAEDPLGDKTIPRGKQHWTTKPERIFYTATTGIWQTVWLEPLPARCIESLHVVPDFDSRTVQVDVVGDGEVEVVATFEGRVVGKRTGSGLMSLEEVHPWSPETPSLYQLRVTLGDDCVDSYFGLRKIETRDGEFWLNDHRYVQRLVLDQGYFPGGLMTPPSSHFLRRDMELAKSLGFNGARKHQKVEDPRYLYWADALGFLVWGEMASFREPSPEAEQRLMAEWADAVVRRREHPCIVAWVPMNESDGLGPNPAPFLDGLYRRTKELDPTRPVVSNDGWEHATTDLCTLHDYAPAAELARRYRTIASALEAPGRTRPPFLPGYAYRGEPVIVSEFGGVGLAGSGGWQYGQVRDADALVETYREMVDALMEPGPVEGFCYTQLYDIEQEQNGLLTFDRTPKADPAAINAITRTAKRR